VGASNQIEKINDEDPSFLKSKECEFIRELIKRIENKDLKSFDNAV